MDSLAYWDATNATAEDTNMDMAAIIPNTTADIPAAPRGGRSPSVSSLPEDAAAHVTAIDIDMIVVNGATMMNMHAQDLARFAGGDSYLNIPHSTVCCCCCCSIFFVFFFLCDSHIFRYVVGSSGDIRNFSV